MLSTSSATRHTGTKTPTGTYQIVKAIVAFTLLTLFPSALHAQVATHARVFNDHAEMDNYGADYISAGVSRASAHANAASNPAYVYGQNYGQILGDDESLRTRYATAFSEALSESSDTLLVNSSSLPIGSTVNLTFNIGYYDLGNGVWGYSSIDNRVSIQNSFVIDTDGGTDWNSLYYFSQPTDSLYEFHQTSIYFTVPVSISAVVGKTIRLGIIQSVAGGAINNSQLNAGEVNDHFRDVNYFNGVGFSWIRYDNSSLPEGMTISSQSGFDYSSPAPDISGLTSPEPGSLALLGVAVFPLVGIIRRGRGGRSI